MPPAQTRSQILSLAEAHMMRGGYGAFSFGDIARVLGVKPAAIHYHFPSKADLALAVIEGYGHRFEAWAASTRDLPPAERLLAYFEIGRRFAAQGLVCPLTLVIAQQEAVPESVVVAVRGVQEQILAFYTETLEAARRSGAAHFSGAAEDQGALIGCTLIGAQLLARVQGPAVFETLLRQQAGAIGLHAPWPPLPPPVEASP
jgi:AcrR family transcriptional regulator